MSEYNISLVGDGGLSRRGFLKGVAGAGAALGLAGIGGSNFFYHDAYAATPTHPVVTDSIPMATTTAPEQLHLTWGADPTREVTVSWLAPGTTALPAPTLAYSTSPISKHNPGKIVRLPAPKPLDQSTIRRGASTTSFNDGLTGFTTYHYHVQLDDLRPGTTYYYEVSDGAATPSVTGASFTTAPAGRAAYRFSSYGDIGTPVSNNASGPYYWTESNDTCIYTVAAIESPGDGGPAPLFHLLNGDLCYANLDAGNTPNVWRDFGVNLERSSKNRPWMPALGNHECEGGLCSHSGQLGGGNWNGPYGYGHYLSRFLLPDNGVVNHDGNHLQGSFYSFQVGTVLYISLDADDIDYQQNQATVPAGTYNTTTLPQAVVLSQRSYTGNVTGDAANMALVPDTSNQPNLQTEWLRRTLHAARNEPNSNGAADIDMIVVFMHQCALSSASAGNGSDMGIRAAWGPLFDEYKVDLVLSGHEHNYERSYPVRGFDAGTPATATAAYANEFGSYTAGEAVSTRRPTPVQTEPIVDPAYGDVPAWNTSEGTVYMILGGGGANSTISTEIDSATGLREALVWVGVGEKNAIEDATWSAYFDTEQAHGYAIFDVDPGRGKGDTTITYQWFEVPTVPNGGSAPALPTTPKEKFVFGPGVGAKHRQGFAPAPDKGREPVGALR